MLCGTNFFVVTQTPTGDGGIDGLFKIFIQNI